MLVGGRGGPRRSLHKTQFLLLRAKRAATYFRWVPCGRLQARLVWVVLRTSVLVFEPRIHVRSSHVLCKAILTEEETTCLGFMLEVLFSTWRLISEKILGMTAFELEDKLEYWRPFKSET